jgi:hypothetical protein
MSRGWAPENDSHTPQSVRNLSSPLSRFLTEANNRMAWVEHELDLLSPTTKARNVPSKLRLLNCVH